MENFNYKLGLLVLVISLAIFFAGNYFFHNYKVNHTLQANLKSVKGITEVQVVKQDTDYRLKLTLAEVKDLQELYLQVQKQADQSLAEETYRLELVGEANLSKQLEAEVELALHEACQTGEFVKLGQRINNYKTRYNLQQTIIQVDEDYIYLTLEKDKQALYKVVNRRRKG